MADIQINNLQMPVLKELVTKQELPTEKGFKFTLLSHIEEEKLQETLTRMIKDITVQGKKISEHMDVRDVKLYRSMISEFLGEVVANSHKFSRDNYLDRRGRHRVYGIVRLVNEKIDELARELIKEERNHLTILEKIGEIEGLLLDLTT